MITKNKYVTVSYELRTNPNEDPIEIADASAPLEFISGNGQTLEYFEMNLLNLNKGDNFEFEIPAQNAYGSIDEERIVELPKDIFSEISEEELVEGNQLPMMDSLGRRLTGIIDEVTETNVIMDFNHPLAGENLYFKGVVLDVRDATDEELEALKSSNCGGCSGCSDDSCGDSCGDGCCH